MLHLHGRAFIWGAVFAAALCLSGCGAEDSSALETYLDDIVLLTEETTAATLTATAAETTTTTSTTTTVTTTETTTTTTTTTATATGESTGPVTIGELPTGGTTVTNASEAPDAYGLTAEDYAFLSDTVFVGDSICSGLRVYGILPNDSVVAKGCVAARNIFDYTFDVRGNEFGVAYALSVLKPRYVVFSMGMNDVNMTTPETYCQNYDTLIKTIRTVLPDSMFFVSSITPITAESTFCTNERIDLFNQTMKQHLQGSSTGFVDVATGLKTWSNAMSPEYNGGDGVHLAPAAYYVCLNQLCDQLVDTRTVGGYANGIAYGWAKKRPAT